MNDELFNTPLLLESEYARVALSLANQANLQTVLFPGDRMSDNEDLFAGYIAIIRVMGYISHRGWRSYESIKEEFQTALESSAVKGIVFDVNSPGGAAAGAFDVADFIYERRNIKPTLAIVNERMTSGAFAIGSAAQRIVMPRTAHIGSVGVITMHVDMSKWLDKIGDNITLIYAGAHKADGNPYEALPDSVRQRIQGEIDKTHELFVSTVARNRSMDPAAVSATEALIYQGNDGVDIGFADEIKAADVALLEFAEQVNNTGEPVMKIKVADLKKQLKDQGIEDDKIANLKLPEDDNAEVDVDTDEGTLSTDGGNNGGQNKQTPSAGGGDTPDEKQRIAAILNSDHAEGREDLAKHFAFDTQMSVQDAEAALQKSPKGSKDPLSEAMRKIEQPGVGSDDQDMQRPTVSQSWDHAFKRVGAKVKDAS